MVRVVLLDGVVFAELWDGCLSDGREADVVLERRAIKYWFVDRIA